MNISYRKATSEDNFNTFTVFLKSIMDYSKRAGVTGVTGGLEPEKIDKLWERRRLLWEHLSSTCDQYWLAENENGEVIGYARSIVREEHRELTEFFVIPGEQSAGVGKELIARAFPNDTTHRSIIATTDFRALARYLKAGVYPFTTELFLERAPELVKFEGNIQFQATENSDATLHIMGEIDSVILGHRRDEDHRYLMQNRTLYLYKRNGQVAGYGYISKDYSGPFALLDKNDFPAVLAHAETQAHLLGAETVGFETPTVNTVAIEYLMSRGYRFEGFMTSILSEKPFGKLENYLLTSPPFFL
ncbi:MAG TPA: GNAT family N-acetyltransferase [Anaerolineales bacterium]